MDRAGGRDGTAGSGRASPGPVPSGSVSVVVPTRNRRELLRVTLDTVLAQGDPVHDVIVVDDGSTDGTAEQVAMFRDPRVRLVLAGGGGVARARNLGLAQARGDWVAFTDDDDLWSPRKISRQLTALRANPSSRWVCSGAVLVDENCQVIGSERPKVSGDVSGAALAANPVPGGASGTVIDRELAVAAGGFDPRFSILADWDLWIRLAQLSPLAVVDEPLHAYRQHAGGMSSKYSATRAELRRLDAKYGTQRHIRNITVRSHEIEFWMAERAQRAGDRRSAAAAYLRASAVTGRRRSVLHAAEALTWPTAFRLRDRRRRDRVDPAWLQEVATWLPTHLPPQ